MTFTEIAKQIADLEHRSQGPVIARWQTEFPRWQGGSIPSDIPEGFEDLSWHNDASPCFWNKLHRLMLWVDHVDPKEREFEGDMRRFQLVRHTRDDWGLDNDTTTIAESDDWEAVKAAIAAHSIAHKWVARFGLGFHPDTRGADYDPPLSPDQIREYDADMETLFAVAGDPYESGLTAMRDAGLIEG